MEKNNVQVKWIRFVLLIPQTMVLAFYVPKLVLATYPSDRHGYSDLQEVFVYIYCFCFLVLFFGIVFWWIYSKNNE